MSENKLGTEENPLPYAQAVAYDDEVTPVELLMQALGNHASDAEVLVPEQCATLYIGGRTLHVTVEELPADEQPLPAQVLPEDDNDDWYLCDVEYVSPRVKLYPLTQAELHAAEENGGVTEHVQWHEITCTEVWVDADGNPRALYEFWYMGEEGQPEWAKFYVSVRDGKLYGEY